MAEREPIKRLLTALRPWLGELVIVGGWAHQLYRLHPLAGAPKYQPLRTRDADVAFAAQAKLVGDIGEALGRADFKEELSSEHTPPITQYHLGNETVGFYAEFLTPLVGSEMNRDGSLNATTEMAGVTAQNLRYLELLLVNPWHIQVNLAEEGDASDIAEVRLPNPTSYLAQKLLIQDRRPSNKRPQDTLYIHDTLELFGNALEQLREEWTNNVRPTMHANAIQSIRGLILHKFSRVDDVTRAAARIPADRVLTPERIQAVCELGLSDIFGAADGAK